MVRYPRIDKTQLFDLEADPGETTDVSTLPTHAKRIARMTRLLEDWRRRLGDPHPLVAEQRDAPHFDYSAVVREPDRHQPAVILSKYFD